MHISSANLAVHQSSDVVTGSQKSLHYNLFAENCSGNLSESLSSSNNVHDTTMHLHTQAELAEAESYPGRPVQLSIGGQVGHGIQICVGTKTQSLLPVLQAGHTANLV